MSAALAIVPFTSSRGSRFFPPFRFLRFSYVFFPSFSVHCGQWQAVETLGFQIYSFLGTRGFKKGSEQLSVPLLLAAVGLFSVRTRSFILVSNRRKLPRLFIELKFCICW